MAEKKYIEIELNSGFTVHVSSLPPYYMDMINDRFPIPEYPSREIALVSGDIVDWPYEPGEDVPEEDHEDYELFVKWHTVDKKRKEVTNQRNTARVDYLLNMCVEIIDGPIEFDDQESLAYKLETAFPDFHIPEDKGQRRLLFIKHFVITTALELNSIVSSSTSQEVSMQGITSALRGFRDNLEEGGLGEDNISED